MVTPADVDDVLWKQRVRRKRTVHRRALANMLQQLALKTPNPRSLYSTEWGQVQLISAYTCCLLQELAALACRKPKLPNSFADQSAGLAAQRDLFVTHLYGRKGIGRVNATAFNAEHGLLQDGLQ
jgi:hypothetical protein